MSLPDITHLQFLVVASLFDGEQYGSDLREKLEDHGEKKNGPAFYQMMARLEESGYVHGHYHQEIIDGQMIKRRRYRIAASGRTACRRACDFYKQFFKGLS